MQVEWGSVADWISAIGGAGAFLVALLLFRSEIRARREDVAEREARQARLVFVRPPVGQGSVGDASTWRVSVPVRNDSDEPIHRLRGWLHWSDPTIGAVVERSVELRGLPPKDGGVLVWEELDLALVPAAAGTELTCLITFIDAGGRLWERRGDDVPRPGRS